MTAVTNSSVELVAIEETPVSVLMSWTLVHDATTNATCVSNASTLRTSGWRSRANNYLRRGCICIKRVLRTWSGYGGLCNWRSEIGGGMFSFPAENSSWSLYLFALARTVIMASQMWNLMHDTFSKVASALWKLLWWMAKVKTFCWLLLIQTRGHLSPAAPRSAMSADICSWYGDWYRSEYQNGVEDFFQFYPFQVRPTDFYDLHTVYAGY